MNGLGTLLVRVRPLTLLAGIWQWASMFLYLGSALALMFPTALGAANWTAWRGPQGTGVCLETNLPLHWGTSNHVRWRVPLPDRGNSTPVIWGSRVFITQGIAPENRRTLICLDRAKGRQRWQTGVVYAEKESSHETNPLCSASPVTDGERIVVSFGSAGLYCYNFSGREIWHRDLGKQTHIWGNAASPILHGDLCILNFGPGERTFLIAVNKRTGETVWQNEESGGHSGEKRPAEEKADWIGSWSTPIVINVDQREELIMTFPKRVAALDPKTGKELWTCRGLNPLVYTSPLFEDGIVVAMGGFMGSSLAVKPGGSGDVTETRRLWQIPKTRQRIGSGVISGGHVYILDDPGVAECFELQTGKTVWEERLQGRGPKNDSWSSMVRAGDRLYAMNQSGDSFVLKASPQFQVIATNSLAETTMSSPVVSDGEIFIRTYKAIWCVSEREM